MRLLLSTFVFSLFVLIGYTQDKTFKLSDSTFQIGAIYEVTELKYSLCTAFENPDIKNKKIIDSIQVFLHKNPSLKIEIGSHTCQRGGFSSNMRFSSIRALILKKALVSRGIEESRIKTKGYGESRPIISQEEINQLPTKEEKENAYQTNMRILIKIIEIH